jgi:hypothetical protein
MSLPTHDAPPWRPVHRPNLTLLDGGQQLMLELEYEIAPGIPAVPEIPADLRVLTAPPTPGDAYPADLPDPGVWAARIARAAAEVAIGERPASQLVKHVAQDELARLARRGMYVQRHPSSRAHRGVRRLRAVRGVHVCLVAPGIVETSAVIVGGQRATAIAIRLEARPGRWLATVVDLR